VAKNLKIHLMSCERCYIFPVNFEGNDIEVTFLSFTGALVRRVIILLFKLQYNSNLHTYEEDIFPQGIYNNVSRRNER
jgi:hypothetical protein